MRLNLYSQNRHIVIIDGVTLSGFAEGDHIQVKVDGNAANRTHGGDGPAMNISSPQGGQVMISLNPISPALGPLYEIRQQQEKNPRMFSMQVVSGVEEIIRCSACAFGEMPQFQTGGPNMQPRQFAIEALQIQMDTSPTEAVAGGLLGGLVG